MVLLRMRNWAELFHQQINILQHNILICNLSSLGNKKLCNILNHRLHENEAVPRFTSWYGAT